jgi:hypothetical protein
MRITESALSQAEHVSTELNRTEGIMKKHKKILKQLDDIQRQLTEIEFKAQQLETFLGVGKEPPIRLVSKQELRADPELERLLDEEEQIARERHPASGVRGTKSWILP